MAIARCQVIIPHDSSLPAEAVVNNWGWEMNDVTVPEMQQAEAWLKTFYDAWSAYRSPAMNWPATKVKWYDLSMPKPRYPAREADMVLAVGTGTTAMPSEVALCLSFQTLRISGAKQANRRGRIYLGPLAITANSQGRPDNALLTALQTAADALLDSSSAVLSPSWAVISETVNGPTGEPEAYPVTDGWIDDAFDTQRRRGVPPSTRKLFPISPA